MRYRPKRFHPPKSRRGRDKVAMDLLGWDKMTISAKVLKNLWPQAKYDSGRKPAWVELSYQRGWMTFARYLQEPNEPGPNPIKSIYNLKSPFFGVRTKAQVKYGRC